MRGFAILLGFLLLGGALNRYAGLPLPGNVLGFLLLAAGLLSGLVPMVWVEDAAHFLLRHMVLFFIPYIVSTLVYFDLVAAQFWPIVLAVLVSTMAVLLVTGWITQFWVRKRRVADGG
ncbi:MAG: CidA/LrgA family protein [Gammaproteobacteria bacterium]|nr:CidA/LrgA family protein [Gammaproteobacteria bacterium]